MLLSIIQYLLTIDYVPRTGFWRLEINEDMGPLNLGNWGKGGQADKPFQLRMPVPHAEVHRNGSTSACTTLSRKAFFKGQVMLELGFEG